MRIIAPDRVIDTAFSIEDPVFCDRVKVGQLVGNLLANAVSHGDPEIPIRLTADTHTAIIFLSLSRTGVRRSTR